jgi:YD repeat-containing protein
MSPLPLRSDDRCELRDDVRGTRTFWFDGTLPVEAILATGEQLRFIRDDGGALRAIDVDGARFLDIKPIADGATRFTKSAIATQLRVDTTCGDRTLDYGGHRLEITHDSRGRLAQVIVPGSPSPIEYRWTARSCTIAPAGGAPLVTIDVDRDAMRVTLADAGCGWRESVPFAPLQAFTIFDRNGDEIASCAIDDDPLRRPAARRWSDGDEDRWRRDEKGRLASWTRVRGGVAERRDYRYDDAGDLIDDGTARRELDAAGRVVALTRADGRIRYRYDAAGRRVARIDAAGSTAYEYDVLGQLTRVVTPHDDLRMTYDGLGRRVAVESSRGTLFEHRDTSGRLWSVTDASGRAVCTFLWFGGRVIARIDGDSDNGVAEGYVTDQGGTLIGVVHADDRFERIDAAPFGTVAASMRPSLYGHFGDTRTGLIHFGARDLDPELGLFLTPDPWSGEPDDPRLWDGLDPERLRAAEELPAATIHPYALCHFDPVARTDDDGHRTNGWGIFREVMLAPTWGSPLTSMSLLFFLPLDIYLELILGFFFLVYKLFCGSAVRAPWSDYHIWKGLGALASGRQGVFALGLNGIFPRLFIGSHPAATIGHVVWMSRSLTNELERPRVLDIWNIGGAPDAKGFPDGTHAFNEDPTKESIVAVTGADANGKNKQLHMTRWTRSFGNAVTVQAVLPFRQRFVDRRLGTEANVPGSIHLFGAMPQDFPFPSDAKAKETLSVQEYIHDPAHDNTATAEIATTPAVAIRIPTKIGAKKGDILEISAPKLKPEQPSVFAAAGEVTHDLIEGFAFDEKVDTLFLDHALPPDFQKDLAIKRINPGGVVSAAKWAAVAGNDKAVDLATPADPVKAAKDDLLQIGAAPDIAWGRVTSVTLTLALTSSVDVAPAAGSDVTLLRLDGKTLDATMKDDQSIHLAAGHPSFASGDLVFVKSEADEAFGRVSAANGDDITLVPAPAMPSGVAVKVERYVETNPAKDVAKVVSAADKELVVTADRADLFPSNSFLAFGSGNSRTLRKVDKLTSIRLALTHKITGAGPFDAKYAFVDKTFDVSGIETFAQLRFLRQTGGKPPSAFGAYPNSIIGVYPDGFPLDGAVYFIKGPAPNDFDTKFRKIWEPQSADGKDFFFLFEDLPIKEEKVKKGKEQHWSFDSGWHYDVTPTGGTPTKFNVVEYRNVGAQRSDIKDGPRVLPREAEVQVPESPTIHDTNARALKEHELRHAVQNSKWGPLLNALPLQMIFRDIDLGFVAAGDPNPPDWLKEFVESAKELQDEGLGWEDILSYGGWLHFAWKYGFTFPARISQDGRDALKDSKFDTWEKVFKVWPRIANPLLLLLDQVPSPRADMPDADRWPAAIVKFIENAYDLRSWTPFLGWVPLWLPDGPKNFLEQQASRASGEKYSAILSVDDLFNMTLRFAADSRDANVKKTLGQSARILLGSHHNTDHYFAPGHAQSPGSPMQFLDGGDPQTLDGPLFRIEPVTLPTGVAQTLFHPDLFENVSGAPIPSTIPVDGPLDIKTGAREIVQFLQVDKTNALQPQLRAFVPMPPHVSRSAGFYFIPAGPGTFTVTGAYVPDMQKRAGNTDPDVVGDQFFADTEHATIDVTAGDVKLGDIDLPWEMPPASGGPPNKTIEMFLTETLRLAVADAKGGKWVLDLNPPKGTITSTEDGTAAWKLRADSATPAHVRLYRVFDKDDAAFDLKFDDVPTLAGTRSYLDKPLWIPIRSFIADIKDVPSYPDATHKTTEGHKIETPIALAGEKSIIITVPPGAPALPKKVTGKAAPRGQQWTIGPPATPVAARTEYAVTVVFGSGTQRKESKFKLAFDP